MTRCLPFSVTLDAEVDTNISVDFDTAEGSALLTDGDFAANNGNSLAFTGNSGGQQTQTLVVTVHGDEKVELNESFLVDLSNLVAAGRDVTIADGQGLGTILNDDSATLSIDDVALNEGDSGRFRVHVYGDSGW